MSVTQTGRAHPAADRRPSSIPWAKTAISLTLEIVKRPDDLHTFKVLLPRQIGGPGGRTLAWITRHVPVRPGRTVQAVPASAR